MKKIGVLILCLIIINSGLLLADNFRLGGLASVGFVDDFDCEDIGDEFADNENVLVGWYWEVVPRNLSFGMSYLVNFDKREIESKGENQWYFDWVGSWDFRYYIFNRFFVNPFVETGVGCAGRLNLRGEHNYNEIDGYRDPLYISIFSKIGVGAAMRLRGALVGAKVYYPFINDPPPGTYFNAYPFKKCQFAVFFGLSY